MKIDLTVDERNWTWTALALADLIVNDKELLQVVRKIVTDFYMADASEYTVGVCNTTFEKLAEYERRFGIAPPPTATTIEKLKPIYHPALINGDYVTFDDDE